MERWAKADWLNIECDIEVSSCGRVRRAPLKYEFVRKGKRCFAHKRAREYKTYVAQTGYPTVAIKANGKRTKYTVHRLVARAFVPGYDLNLSVNHINGIKTDNRAENLEWVSLARNTELQWATGLVDLRGENHPSSKLTTEQVKTARKLIANGVKQSDIAKLLSLSSAMVSLIHQRKRWATAA